MKKTLFQVFGLAIFAVAVWVLHSELKAYHYHQIVNQINALPVSQLLFALFVTVLGYFVLTGYDVLAIKYIGRSVRYPQIAAASFISYAFSNNVSHPLITGAIRYRLYSVLGFSAIEITQIIAFCAFTLWLGFFTLGGVMFVVEPLTLPSSFHLPFQSVPWIGGIFLILTGVYLSGVFLKPQVKIAKWEVTLPSPRIAISQMVTSSLDWGLASLVLYILLPTTTGLSYPKFLGMFLLAQVLGMLSQVPGGIGVFEMGMIVQIKSLLPADVLMGSLVAYRTVYYLCPLIVAIGLLAVQEFRLRQAMLKRAVDLVNQWVSPVIPHVFALTTFVGGIILLFSGATPAVRSRLLWLEIIVPLPVIELSHFLGSIAGVGLLLLARGLQRRLDGAYVLTIIVLSMGIVSSLLKGLDYEEAFILLLMLLALLPSRTQFYRKTSLLNQRFSPGWLLAVLLVVGCSIWLGFFAYKHVSYSNELWWHFSIHGNAPRFLRASFGTVAVVLFIALSQLIRTVTPPPKTLSAGEWEHVQAIVKEAPKTYVYLALLGDKQFLLSPTQKAFIMYGVEGKSWVAMGDPVGAQDEYTELVWQFRELCDRHGGWPVFYEVNSEHLPLYIDQGLTLLKLGEEARVPLTTFSLEGNKHKHQRYLINKLEKEGGRFEIISQEQVSAFLPEFRAISDDWLQRKNTSEKRFSLGWFHPEYLLQTPVGVVRQHDNLVAFANILCGGPQTELSIDLMRYSAAAPANVMEYLFLQLILWGKQAGYAWFNLGMAPFSGIESRMTAPLWNRLSMLLFRQGEHFYNFQGLRQYKEKFDPVWEPKYLASPGGVALPIILTNVAALVSGSLKGVVSR